MHIAIDGWPLGERMKGGTSVYTLNLVNWLPRVDSSNEYTVYQPLGATWGARPGVANLTVRSLPSGIAGYYASLYREIKRKKPRILLSGVLPFTPKSVRLALVVYTLSHMVYGRYVPPISRAVWSSLTSLGMRRASHVIALSQSGKRDIERLFGAGHPVSVVYPGCDGETFRPVENKGDIEPVKEKYGVDGPYILYAGVLEPRKDLATLVKAVATLRRDRGVNHKLVIGGRNGWRCQDVFRVARKSGLGSNVVFTGYVPYPDYPRLLAGADVFVYPSLHEGFGLPVLEAMSCGVPVITCNTSCFPEVVGDAGLMVEPGNVSPMGEAILRVISDSTLSRQMVNKGLQRAAQFTWERTARQTLQVFGKLIEEN